MCGSKSEIVDGVSRDMECGLFGDDDPDPGEDDEIEIESNVVAIGRKVG